MATADCGIFAMFSDSLMHILKPSETWMLGAILLGICGAQSDRGEKSDIASSSEGLHGRELGRKKGRSKSKAAPGKDGKARKAVNFNE